MKTARQIRTEIRKLKKLAASVPGDERAQISIAAQLNALTWASYTK